MPLIYKGNQFYGKCSNCGSLTTALGSKRDTAWEQFILTGWIRPGHSSERKHLCDHCSSAKLYGIWNSIEKRFVLGIEEPTKQAAWCKLIRAVGRTGYKCRFEIRLISSGFKSSSNKKFRTRCKD